MSALRDNSHQIRDTYDVASNILHTSRELNCPVGCLKAGLAIAVKHSLGGVKWNHDQLKTSSQKQSYPTQPLYRAMGLSLACQVTGKGKWGNFIAQWVPTSLIIGLYNKLVEMEGHDRYDRGRDDESRLTPADEANAPRSI